VINCRKDGTEFPVYLSTSVIKDDLNQPIALIGVATDITEEKQKRQELIDAKEIAERADRLKSEFLAQMSHEIRSPMNIALNYSYLLREVLQDNLTAEIVEYLDGIDSSGRRLMRTINLILNIAELESKVYNPIWENINIVEQVLQQMLKNYSVLAEQKGIELSFTYDNSSLYVYGDKYSIYELLSNLIDNAVKYTFKGWIKINLGKNEKNEIMLTIEDTGIGISEEYLQNIFTPFLQEDHGYSRQFEGNGLGMALVKKYCNLNRIDIKIESKKGAGTKITLIFNSNKILDD
jgi:signal transduction histidine kinase